MKRSFRIGENVTDSEVSQYQFCRCTLAEEHDKTEKAEKDRERR